MPIAEHQLRDIATDIWSAMLGIALTPCGEPVAHPGADGALTGCVQITGAWEGAVTVDMPVPLARRACATISTSTNATAARTTSVTPSVSWRT